MKVNGREVGFLKTVEAACRIGEICPDKNVNNVGVLFKNFQSTTEELTAMAYFIECMSNGYESAKEFQAQLEGKEYTPRPVTIAEVMTLDEDTMSTLWTEAVMAFLGEKPTVEVEEPKKKVKKAKAETSD